MFKPTYMALAAYCALTFSTPAGALELTPRVTARAATAKTFKPGPRKQLPILAFTPPAPELNLIKFASMDGWTALTNTATIGGASLFEAGGAFQIAVTGSDKTLYTAAFTPLSPGPIPSTTWQNSPDVSFWSQPSCMPAREPVSRPDYYILCAGLGQTGNALAAMLQRDGDGYYPTMEPADLGGQDAGSAPAFTGYSWVVLTTQTAKSLPDLHSFDLPLYVWGGANGKVFKGSFRLTAMASTMKGVTEAGWFYDVAKQPWAILTTAQKAVPSCALDTTQDTAKCVVATYDGRVRLFAAYIDPNTDTNTPTSPPLSVGLSGETATVRTKAGRRVVLARGNDGKLYQTAFDGKSWSAWKSEGGYMIAHTVPSCVAINETAICAVQGSDGRIYARQLNSAGAL
ncbi:hypothetical protein [Asticcacaulis sp. 201]|uniref:hypothetical protein n=1 Tax=Asticcacaulis sp. 201 TaxID=3028787 RepID=UPI0029169C18|nr:hypothetical protein [Asticcacaulis sp. 201]MDV6331235.1 hypothetical protein [Asticcacaulis sp. 201]